MGNNITEMTDIAETVSILRTAKNFFFFVAILSLLVLGIIFAMGTMKMIVYPWDQQLNNDNLGMQDIEDSSSSLPALSATVKVEEKEVEDTEEEPSEPEHKPLEDKKADLESIEQQAAKAVAVGVEEMSDNKDEDKKSDNSDEIEHKPLADLNEQFGSKLGIISWAKAAMLIKLCNFTTFFSLILYTFSLVLSVKITLVGRLGSVASITGGMFLAMIATVMFMPWQLAFSGSGLYGAMFMPYEFASAAAGFDKLSTVEAWMHYARYAGLWICVVLFLIMAQGRSMFWAARCSKRA